MEAVSFDVLLKGLLTSQPAQILVVNVVGQCLHRLFAAMDTKKPGEQGQVVLNVILTVLTLLTNLLSAWSQGHAGLVDTSQWTQFLVMLFAVFGLNHPVSKAADKVQMVMSARKK